MSESQFLSSEQVDAFDRDGYVIAEIFTEDEVSRMKEMVWHLIREPKTIHPRLLISAALKEPHPGLEPTNPYAVFKVFNTPLAGDDWFAMIKEPRILRAVADLIGPDINFFMGFLHMRPPGVTVHEGWHRDFEEDRNTVPELVTAITYLDDMTPDSGPTLVWPGSHKSGLIEATMEPRPFEDPPDELAVPATVRAGSVLFLHCLTVHRLSPNRTTKDRAVILNEYKSAAAVETSSYAEFAFTDLPLLRAGLPV